MPSTTNWINQDLRAQWEETISPKLVDYFERFVSAPNAAAFKSKNQHHDDTGIPLKHIDRRNGSLVAFLATVGLIQLERRGELFRVIPLLPVSTMPPNSVQLPLYASFRSGGRTRVNRRRIYDLDGGICSYCGKPVEFENCVIDHIYPFDKGGADNEENLTAQCRKCKKWHYVPGDVGWRDPILFRGKRIKKVSFVKKNGFYWPEFEFDGSVSKAALLN